MRVNPSDDFSFELPNLRVEDGGPSSVYVLVSILEAGLVVVLGNCEVIDFEIPQALVPFGGTEGGGIVEELVEQRYDCRQAI